MKQSLQRPELILRSLQPGAIIVLRSSQVPIQIFSPLQDLISTVTELDQDSEKDQKMPAEPRKNTDPQQQTIDLPKFIRLPRKGIPKHLLSL